MKTWQVFKEWHNKYTPLVDLKGHEDLKKNKQIIDKLDEEGLQLTRKIAKEWKNVDIERFIYFSYGYYSFISIDRNGNEVKIENPLIEDWYKYKTFQLLTSRYVLRFPHKYLS